MYEVPEICYTFYVRWIAASNPYTIVRKGYDIMEPASAQEKVYTINDIYSLPEGSRRMDCFTKKRITVYDFAS